MVCVVPPDSTADGMGGLLARTVRRISSKNSHRALFPVAPWGRVCKAMTTSSYWRARSREQLMFPWRKPCYVLTAQAACSTSQNEPQQTIRPARGVARELAADLEFICACLSASAMTQVRRDRPDMCCTNHRKVEITARSMQPWPRYGRPA